MNPDFGEISGDQIPMGIELEHGLGIPSHYRARIGHGPGQVRGQPPVAVARELASEPPNRLPDRKRGSAHVGSLQEWNLVETRDDPGGENTAEHTPVPDKPR